MTNKFLITLTSLLCILPNCFANSIIYYCPAPNDFKNINNKLIAKTSFHSYNHTWQVYGNTSSQFPEYPLTFKGANLVHCKNNLCQLKCYYYSNIEGHIITSIIQSNKNIHIYQHLNHYLQNFNCQYTEHVDCPFIIDVFNFND